ncbi:ABC transporter permease [Natrinema salifodinae]|uniref:NitT/TauT family transport system permease protein n=1 Tax=Natrinema salifodinae TaxID=1202768 RepID=A0A1I0M0F3_9EURY|nr:ABC transporter permease [Natrinema salifodinae]SEV80408.1 NitT/TauT family transport system permease protein [Natrinema salifodinae]
MSYADFRFDALDETLPAPFRRVAWFVVEWIPLVIVAGLWELASGTVVSSEILPPPTAVFRVTWDLLASGQVLPHLQMSLYRIAVGLGLSIAVGVALGVGMARSKPIENVFEVFLALLYPIPKAALVPLAILWLGVGTETAILIVFLACLLPIVLNSYNAARDVDRNLIWSAQMMGMPSWKIPIKVVVPATIPSILTGIRQAIPIAFIALVSAELIASNQGIGFEILRYGQIGNYTSMFAVLVIISGAAFFAVRGYEWLERKVVRWT